MSRCLRTDKRERNYMQGSEKARELNNTKNGKKRKPGANFLSAEKKEKTTHFLPHFESTSESINGAEELRTF